MSWLSLFRRSRTPRTRQVPPRRHRVRPVLEMLEDRLAPALFTVNTLNDPSIAGGVNTDGTIVGMGTTVSLRSAIEAANATPGGNTIELSLTGTYLIQQMG